MVTSWRPRGEICFELFCCCCCCCFMPNDVCVPQCSCFPRIRKIYFHLLFDHFHSFTERRVFQQPSCRYRGGVPLSVCVCVAHFNLSEMHFCNKHTNIYVDVRRDCGFYECKMTGFLMICDLCPGFFMASNT